MSKQASGHPRPRPGTERSGAIADTATDELKLDGNRTARHIPQRQYTSRLWLASEWRLAKAKAQVPVAQQLWRGARHCGALVDQSRR